MKEITGHTQVSGVLGRPISHSISPQMHNEAFRQLNMDCVYLAFEVGVDGMQTAVEGLRALNVRGYNVTMPNKNIMATLCDRLSPAAEIIGAVNTVVNEHGVLTGHTTDGTGYMRAVQDAGHNIIGKKMTLLGAGGASLLCSYRRHSMVYQKDLYLAEVPANLTNARKQLLRN